MVSVSFVYIFTYIVFYVIIVANWGCNGFDRNSMCIDGRSMLTLQAKTINANKIKNVFANMFGGNRAVAFA